MHSAIYHGSLRHRRHAPRAHVFSYPLFMVYLDLAELDRVFRGRGLWSATRAAPARFERADHLGDPVVPLDTAVRDLVEARRGRLGGYRLRQPPAPPTVRVPLRRIRQSATHRASWPRVRA